MFELAIDLAKVGGGMCGLVMIQWIINYTGKMGKPKEIKKANGSSVCKEHMELAKTTIESNTILKSMRTENRDARVMARDERGKLFEFVGELKEDVSAVKTDVEVLKTKVKYMETEDPLPARELQNYMFLILDDQVAESTCKIIESYFGGFATCIPATTINEAMELLSEQKFRFCIIDYFLNEVENGYEFYKYCKRAYPDMQGFVYSGKKPQKIEADLANIWLDKPFSKDVIVEKINAYL